jgi:hypothetical protein
MRLETSTAIFIYPIEGGAGRQQPYAVRWFAAENYRQMPLRVRKRLRPGGYTIEARIPTSAVVGFKSIPGAVWNMRLTYQNVNEIYQTQWEGVVTLQP